ncbi:unnamed protein product [Bursaphelenchus xylophilus]|uniref:(pine wood nematode) hypothetical protein n=1 Tax=Bursaphelenchus xylophilus TaxID=6326 RepID=A0A1I7RYW6_BURXY|nr:unnamed protein product [Bursaphelenchus xylophilus]CAG9092126.1 unnamed protein product [Bursaphelenchus xylophilus]
MAQNFFKLAILVVALDIFVAQDTDWKSAVFPVAKTNGSGENVNLNYQYLQKYAVPGSPVLLHLALGAIDSVVKNQAFLSDLAQHFNATVIVIRHRDYQDIQYFLPSQAFQDFNVLYAELTENKQNPAHFNASQPVVLSGFGYSGLLALWWYKEHNYDGRFKSALISDAPVNLFKGFGLSLGDLDHHLKEIYEKADCDMDLLNTAVNALKAENLTVFKDMGHILGLQGVDVVKADEMTGEIVKLEYFIHDAFVKLAADEQDFAEQRGDQNFAAKPVESYCDSLNTTADTDLASKLAPIKLLLKVLGKDRYGFEYLDDDHLIDLFCNQLPPYSCPQGPPNDFFAKKCGNEEEWKSYWEDVCSRYKKTNVVDPDYVAKHYKYNYDDLKNTVFVYGNDDVWSVARPKTNAPVYTVPQLGRARIFDQPNTCDSNALKQFRFQLINALECHLDLQDDEDICGKLKGNLPEYKQSDAEKCEPELLAYPWGQVLDADGGKGNETDKHAAGIFVSIFVIVACIFMIFSE